MYRLVICSNNIASEGLCAVARAMRSNGSLHALYIWGNKLEEPACKVRTSKITTHCIIKLLEKIKMLRREWLSERRITDLSRVKRVTNVNVSPVPSYLAVNFSFTFEMWQI